MHLKQKSVAYNGTFFMRYINNVNLLSFSARAILAAPFVRSELLKFIEEKEFLLEQSKTPMPKGSRPYSTPVLLG